MMKPIAPTDTDKPLETLRACIDELNAGGSDGKLVWSDGFAVSLGTIVRVEITTVDDPRYFFLAHAMLGFEQGGEHHGGIHVHKIVNWYADDPPLEFAVIDVEGRTLEFWLIEPSCQPEEAKAHAVWREQMDRQPEVRDAALARMQEALESMAREWPEDY
ncbi:MAG: hypothetical protein ACYDBB_02645 [Armatimonadota bacterium]